MSVFLRRVAALFVAGSCQLSLAAAPLSVETSALLDAPPAKVWATIGHFDDLSWHPAVASTTISAGKPGQAGALREVKTHDGALIVESQISQDDARHALSYRIVESPLPVQAYVSELEVRAEGQGSRVVWRSHFEASPGVGEQAARDTVSGIYQAGLSALGKRFGAAGH